MAVELNIAAFKHVPFGGATGDGDIPVAGVDWHSAAFRMELRTERGQTASSLVALVTASAGSQGISATYDAGYTLPDGSVTPSTIIRIQIDEATLEALSLAAPTDGPLVLFYDLHVTPSGLPKFVLCFGTFTIYPGATV